MGRAWGCSQHTCGAGPAPIPRFPRTAVPAGSIPFSPLFPRISEHSPGQGRAPRSPRCPLAPGRGWGRSCSRRLPRGGTSARFAAWFICVWKGSTAPSPSKNREIWAKLRSVCLGSVLWLILCGYKCSYFIILICERLLLAVSSQGALGTGVHMGKAREMPNYTRRRAPSPRAARPQTFPFLTSNFQRAPLLSRPAGAGSEGGFAENFLETPKKKKKLTERQKRVRVFFFFFLDGWGNGTERRAEGGGSSSRRRRRVGRADLNHAIYSESYQKSASPIWFSSACRMRQGGCLPCADLFNFTLPIIH